MIKMVFNLLCCFGISSFAGVQSVGKGGGFAEMQAYSQDQNLLPLINYCLKPGNFCKFTNEELKIVNEFSRFLRSTNRQLLKINETCIKPFLHFEKDHTVSIDSCRLYQTTSSEFGPLPISYNEIQKLVTVARLLWFQPQLSENTTQSISNKLAVSLHFEDRQTIVPVKNSKFLMHIWTSTYGGNRVQFLTIETFKNSWDVTKNLLQALQCPTANYQVGSFQFMENPSGVTGKSNILWSCGSQKFKASLYMDLKFDQSELAGVEFNLFQKEQL